MGTGNVIRYNLVYENLKYGIFNEATQRTAILCNVVYGQPEATGANGSRGIDVGQDINCPNL